MITKKQLNAIIENVLNRLNGPCPYKIKFKNQAVFNGGGFEQVVCCDKYEWYRYMDNIHITGYSRYFRSYEVRRW